MNPPPLDAEELSALLDGGDLDEETRRQIFLSLLDPTSEQSKEISRFVDECETNMDNLAWLDADPDDLENDETSLTSVASPAAVTPNTIESVSAIWLQRLHWAATAAALLAVIGLAIALLSQSGAGRADPNWQIVSGSIQIGQSPAVQWKTRPHEWIASAVEQDVMRHAVKVRDMSEVIRGDGVLRSSAQRSDFQVVSPMGAYVQSTQPTFVWTRVEGAASYFISIWDEETSELVYEFEAPQRGDERISSSPPEPLMRGRIYSWEVAARPIGTTAPTRPQGDAVFGVLAEDEHRQMEEARAALSNDSHFELGILYGRMGLLDDAEEAFARVVESNPQSDVTKTLLESIARVRPRSEVND